MWSSETQNMPREVSFTTTESEDSSIKLASAQTPYLYSLILQIWHNKRVTSREPITNDMAYLYTILVYLRHLQDSLSEKLTNSFQEHALNMWIESLLITLTEALTPIVVKT